MALDQTANFVRVRVSGTHNSTDTTISLATGAADELPDPVNGEYNLVWWDDTNNPSPATDPEVEIVRVTGRDTVNDTITVQRGQENTSAIAHDTADATYRMILSNTSKIIQDVDVSLQNKIDSTSISEVIADTSGNLPAAGTSGRLFFETDTGRVLFDDGTSWVEVGLSESQISLANLASKNASDLNVDYLDFNDRTTDPSLAAGVTWFRSDESLLKFSPDGSTTQAIGWTI